MALGLSSLLIIQPAWADPSDYYGAPSNLCTITDSAIDELSGLVALPGGEMLAVEDSTPEPRPGSTTILMYRLSANCAVEGGGPANFAQDPRDIEDLAFRDGMLWFADIGDNGVDRQNIALITVPFDPSGPPESPVPQVFRFVYPDGPHDAEALLLPPNATPYVVTKELDGTSGVYRPGAPLDATGEVGLDKVAEVEFDMTGTPGGPVGRAGQVLVTGGAVSADGRFVALRTYTDAYVWALTASDVPAAVAAPPLAVVALPDSPQGEAISFAPDSPSLFVGSEGVSSVVTAIPATPLLNDGESDPGGASTVTTGQSTTPVSPGTGLIGVVVVLGLVWLYRKLTKRKPGTGAHGH